MKTLLSTLLVAATLTVTANTDEYAAEGGMLYLWPKNPGMFAFVNAQERVPEKTITKEIVALKQEFQVNLKTIKGNDAPFDIRTAPSTIKNLGAVGAIWIVDDPSLPVCLAATESIWGVLNVAPILADTPDDDKLNKRITKYLRRIFGNVNGSGEAMMMPACVMNQATSMAAVDQLKCLMYSPETHTKIRKYLGLCGLKQQYIGTYTEACEAGWAPQPTNDVQKAIWDKVHAKPTAPIKIKPGDKPRSRK